MNAPFPIPLRSRKTVKTCWTADPVVAELLSCLRALSVVGKRLHNVSGDVFVSDAASEVGEVATIYDRIPTRDYQLGHITRPNGGVCVTLWEAIDDRRRAYMAEILRSEGLTADTVEGFDRWMEIDGETLTVADAWGVGE